MIVPILLMGKLRHRGVLAKGYTSQFDCRLPG